MGYDSFGFLFGAFGGRVESANSGAGSISLLA